MTAGDDSLGRRAEAAVARFLERQGYQIVGHNLRLGHLELDIVARVDTTIVVVEVRTRGAGAWTTAIGSIDGNKRSRIRRAGERLWQRRYKNDTSVDRMRFDAAAVSFEGDEEVVEYVVAAF